MTDELLCKECGKPYEPQYYDIKGWLSSHILIGDGKCPACAHLEGDEYEAQEAREHLADIAKRRRARREKSGIPSRFMEQDFSTFKKGRGDGIDDALKHCIRYAEEYPLDVRPKSYRSLYIYSEQSWGVGKTHLSCAIVHRVLDRWTGQRVMSSYGFEVESNCPTIKWVSEPQLFSKIEASFNYTQEDKQILPNKDDIINELINCDLLILDDVGKEQRQDPRFIQRTLFAIINGRYDRDYPMLITANLKPSLLKKHLGASGTDEASYDRFVEMTHNKSVQIDGTSYR
ncbi:hypothetical protein LCGC14_2595950, partial [marine sediment metagenome]